MNKGNYICFTKSVKASLNQIKKMVSGVLLISLVASCSKESTQQKEEVQAPNTKTNLEYRMQKAPKFLNEMIAISKALNKTETTFMNTDSALIYMEDALNYALDSVVDYTLIFNDSVETPISNLNTIGLSELANATVNLGKGIQSKLKAVNYDNKGIISIRIKKAGSTLKCYYNYGLFTADGTMGKGPGGPVFVANYWYPPYYDAPRPYRYFTNTSPDMNFSVRPEQTLIAACMYQYNTYTPGIVKIPPSLIGVPLASRPAFRKVFFNHYKCDQTEGSIGVDAALNPITTDIAQTNHGGYLPWNVSGANFPSNSWIAPSVIPYISCTDPNGQPRIKGSQMNYYKEVFPTLIAKHKTYINVNTVGQDVNIMQKELSNMQVNAYPNTGSTDANGVRCGYFYLLTYSDFYFTFTFTNPGFN